MCDSISSPINKPFDPSSLKCEVKNTTIGELCAMLKNNLIDLQPDFQRHGDLWNKTKKSLLIESLILGLPLPSFYFFIDREQKKWVVIDGLQRLCTLNDFFVEKSLRLIGLKFLKDSHQSRNIDDFTYFEQLEMSMRSVTLNILSGESSIEAKYIMFQRINSNGTKLTPSEVRNALFHGSAMEFAKKLALSSKFVSATNNEVSFRRLSSLDYVLRFLAFYLCSYENYRDDKMNDFIGNVLERINKTFQEEDYDNLSNIFYHSLDLCKELLGAQAFRKPLSEQEKKNKDIRPNKVSIALFEATMCAVSKLNSSQEALLLQRKESFWKHYCNSFNDESFQKHISNGTNKFKAVFVRFSTLENVVKNTLNPE